MRLRTKIIGLAIAPLLIALALAAAAVPSGTRPGGARALLDRAELHGSAACQMLAAVALMLGTVVLFRMKRERYAWVAMAPAAWLLVCTLTAGWLKIFSADPKVGFLSHAAKYADGLAQGVLLAPAKTPEAMARIVFNDRLDAALCGVFIFVVLSVLFYSARTALAAGAAHRPTTRETPYEPLPLSAT